MQVETKETNAYERTINVCRWRKVEKQKEEKMCCAIKESKAYENGRNQYTNLYCKRRRREEEKHS